MTGDSMQKIAFVGPFGVGKTTALQSISDVPITGTDVHSTEVSKSQVSEGKTTTTVGMEYGYWFFNDGARVELLGVPGQKRFEAVWNVLLPQCTAVVLWLSYESNDFEQDLDFWLDVLDERDAISRIAVAITRLPSAQEASVLQRTRELVQDYHPYAPVLVADPRETEHVVQAVMMALSTPYFEDTE